MGISHEQALDCFNSDDLLGIGMEADAVRRRLHPEGVVSYVVERNIDSTGAATATGPAAEAFCERIYTEISHAVDLGGSVVRLVFGAAQTATGEIEWLEGLLRGIRQRFPAVWVEGLSALDVVTLVGGRGRGVKDTIARLRGAGLHRIAGDDTVIRHDREDGATRRGCSQREWLEVHRAAHELGMRTVAAIPFGAGETPDQRVDFLDAVRRLQEETGGFAAFAPASCEAAGGRERDCMTAVERLKILAISRMFLDNIENVQASRAGQGLKVPQTALRFGANDVGPVSPTDAKGLSEEDLRRVIRDAGFIPVERDASYQTMFLN